MNKIFQIAQREFWETVHSKVFLLNLFLTPLLVVGVLWVSTRLTRKTMEGARPAKTVAVSDLSQELSAELERVFARQNKSNPQRQINLKLVGAGETRSDSETLTGRNEVQQGKLDAYVVLAKEVVRGEGQSYYYMKTRNVADLDLFSTVQKLINDAVVNLRFRQRNLSQELYAELHRWVALDQVDVRAKAAEKRHPMILFMIPFFFLFLMFTGVFAMNQQILTSVIEEKNSRVIEVILSAVSPFQLMVGKILGLVGAGLTLVIVWGTTAYGVACVRGMSAVMTAGMFTYFVFYYLLGFLLISSIFAAMGSACNTIKEAQTLMMPLMIMMILPLVTWFFITQHPNGLMAVVLSFIPPLTPMIMMLRIAAHPELSLVQILASFAVLAASVPAVMWASAKIFRTGILMYGKPPTPRELWRWLRYP